MQRRVERARTIRFAMVHFSSRLAHTQSKPGRTSPRETPPAAAQRGNSPLHPRDAARVLHGVGFTRRQALTAILKTSQKWPVCYSPYSRCHPLVPGNTPPAARLRRKQPDIPPLSASPTG